MSAMLSLRVRVLATAGLALALLLGCDVGRELVDRRVPADSIEAGCAPVPSCDAAVSQIDFTDSVPSGAKQVSFSMCGASADQCSFDAVLDAGELGDADVRDAGVDAGPNGTAGACNPNQPAEALERAALNCKNARVVLDPSTRTTLVQGAELSNVNLLLASAAAVTLTLDQSSLQHVFVQLEGPVTLRITHSLIFDDVGIAGRADEHGVPRVAIEDAAAATQLSIGQSSEPFAGEVDLTRCKLRFAVLSADAIELSSVHAETIAIASRSLLAADTALQAGTLVSGNASFSASHLTQVTVLSCDALALLSTTVDSSVLPACRNEPLRAYSANISASSVDGAIDSDASSWEGVRFGMHAATELLGWGSEIVGATFCQHSVALRFGATANVVRCSSCVADALPMPLCVVPTGQVGSRLNLCPALDVPDGGLPDCEGGPFPARPRPQ